MDSVCDYFTNYTGDMVIELQLTKYNETDPVLIDGSSIADVVIKQPKECKSSSMQLPFQSSTTAVNSGVIAAIALAIIAILAVVGAIGTILVYRRKTMKTIKMDE